MSDHHVLLQTDIVDSTRIAEQLGDEAWAALSEAHDIAARDLLPKWRGREIDKSDGFLLLFSSVADAVGYAAEYHKALGQFGVTMQARAGIHSGPVAVREISAAHIARGAKRIEIEGLAKPFTARVMSVASGGQTLLSAIACRMLDASAFKCRSHGNWRLKGLDDPVELFEVEPRGYLTNAPRDSDKAYRVVHRRGLWLPLRDVRHSLPAERDSFVGRREPLRHVSQRFDAGARLVTIAGPGGAGKTRLAKRVAWSRLGDFSGGVWFCDLAQAVTIDGISYAVGQGLDVPLAGAGPLGQLTRAIAGRGQCLIVLDNFEQVVKFAEASLGHWLDRAAEARFLVTSREALGIIGEFVMTLDPMPAKEGESLFVQRAAAASSGYEPTTEDSAAIGPLVKMLDGLPLAIELAAARIRVMSPSALLHRIGERFELLKATNGRPDRQATLRATIDWSWELLSKPEKRGLAQLSVFEGGFTLEAAEAVVDLSARGAFAPCVTDVVQGLVEKSLVQLVSGQRFELLSTLQAYASRRLEVMDVRERCVGRTHRRHWQYFAAMEEQTAIAERCVDADNIVAACRRATAGEDGVNAVATLKLAWAVIKLRGPSEVAVQLSEDVKESLISG